VLNIAVPMPSVILSKKLNIMNVTGVGIIDTNLHMSVCSNNDIVREATNSYVSWRVTRLYHACMEPLSFSLPIYMLLCVTCCTRLTIQIIVTTVYRIFIAL